MNKQPLSEIVQSLIAAGMTEAEIAAAINERGVAASQATIHRIKRGTTPNPNWLLGCELVDLAKRISRRKTATS